MRYRLPPLNSLRLFEAAARLLSFKAAANELLLTPSAVSHGIQSLEDWLGTTLFERTSRGLVLTPTGQAYFPVVRDALAALASASERASARRGNRRLAISTAPTFAARWLLPRLPRFRERHPDIDVMIDTAQERIDLSGTAADLAIRMGRGDWDGLTADRLFPEELVPVCAPALAARLRKAGTIDDVMLIHVTTVSEDWAYWAQAAGRAIPAAARGLRFDTIQMAFDAACQGLGVAIGRRPLVNPDIEAGRLEEIWPPAVTSTVGYWLVCAPARADESAIAAFRQCMAEEAAAPAQCPRTTCRGRKR